MEPEQRTRSERLDETVRGSPPVRIAALVLFLLLIAGQLTGYTKTAWHWVTKDDWRVAEYAKLRDLHSDLTLARFDAVLGAPLISRREGKWEVRVYPGKDYWVQTVSRRGSESAGFYSVTSCADDFKPKFQMSGLGTITLHTSRLNAYPDKASKFRTFPTADAAPYYFVSSFPYHGSNFKAFAWGDGGVCGGGFPEGLGIYARPPIATIGQLSDAALARAAVNTYAEWGPIESDWPAGLWFGLTEVDVNTISGKCVVGCVGNVDK